MFCQEHACRNPWTDRKPEVKVLSYQRPLLRSFDQRTVCNSDQWFHWPKWLNNTTGSYSKTFFHYYGNANWQWKQNNRHNEREHALIVLRTWPDWAHCPDWSKLRRMFHSQLQSKEAFNESQTTVYTGPICGRENMHQKVPDVHIWRRIWRFKMQKKTFTIGVTSEHFHWWWNLEIHNALPDKIIQPNPHTWFQLNTHLPLASARCPWTFATCWCKFNSNTY